MNQFNLVECDVETCDVEDEKECRDDSTEISSSGSDSGRVPVVGHRGQRPVLKKMILVNPNKGPEPVRPDWAIFESSWQNICLQK